MKYTELYLAVFCLLTVINLYTVRQISSFRPAAVFLHGG
jgi:hypothetical protein